MKKKQSLVPVWYPEDPSRPLPNFTVDRSVQEWTLRFYSSAKAAADAGLKLGIKNPKVRSIRKLQRLRGILLALTTRYPEITAITIEKPNYAPPARFLVNDIIGVHSGSA